MSDKVINVLNTMSIEEKVAQTLIPILFTYDHPVYNVHEYLKMSAGFTEKYGLGGFFILRGETGIIKEYSSIIQEKNPKVPSLVAGDLENGAGRFGNCTEFPALLAVGAANDEKLAYELGKSTAIEGRELGFNWTYTPVVDILKNPNNPITQNRCYGDDPERIIAMAKAHIRGMQDHGMAACVKHFPGDGVDSRDQHVTTSVNTLSAKEWMDTFGKVYKETINGSCGSWSLMTGHIGLPAFTDKTSVYNIPLPATLSKELGTHLLRDKLGFDGLVVSDALGMGGITGVMEREERIIETFNAGSDMLLFCRLDYFDILMKGLEDKRISEKRLDEAVTRILTLKNKLGMLENYQRFTPGPTAEEKKGFEEAAVTLTDKSIYVVRNEDAVFPIKKRGKKALVVTLKHEGNFDLDTVVEELENRGYEVDRSENPVGVGLPAEPGYYDHIFVNFVFPAEWALGSCRSIGPFNRIFMEETFYAFKGTVIYTSFASPYHLRDVPQLPNLINAHSPGKVTQREVVKAWFGEIDVSKNTSPVRNLTRY